MHEYELKCLSSKRKNKTRSIGAMDRPSMLDIKDRCIMLLVYYRLYITSLWLDFSLIWIKRATSA
jgi:hypothetical protein